MTGKKQSKFILKIAKLNCIHVTLVILDSGVLSTVFTVVTYFTASDDTRVLLNCYLKLIGLVQKEKTLFSL